MYSIGIGSKTSTGGEVVEGNTGISMNGLTASSVGHKATCKSGRKECRGIGPIVAVGERDVVLPSGPAARAGDYVDCGCPPGSNTLIGVGNVQVGSSSIKSGATTLVGNTVISNHTDATTITPSNISSTVEHALPKVNPNNMYWPPYNPLASKGEKEIRLEYTHNVIKFAVLGPNEWAAFFNTFDIAKNLKDSTTGLYNARETAKALGGVGVTAFVRTIGDVDYVVLKNYEYWKQTLLHGGIFKADSPRVVKLGLGALDSAKGMIRYVKLTAPMEILVGSAMNALQFIVNDEYTLAKLGVDQAKLFVHVFVVAGVALGAGAIFTGVAATVTGKIVILVLSNAFVWGVDKWTDFEKKLIEQTIKMGE